MTIFPNAVLLLNPLVNYTLTRIFPYSALLLAGFILNADQNYYASIKMDNDIFR